MSAVHPVFAGILDSIESTRTHVSQAQRAAYVRLLQAHDWSYDYSDDIAMYRRGRDQLAQLRIVQKEIDADFAIWNQHAPERCKDGKAYQ